MRSVSRWSLIVLIPLLLSAGISRAQWTNVSPALISGAGFWGAMQFRNGILWTGANSLWSSPDSGKTWQQSKTFPTAEISDIAFYDKLHGIIATRDRGVFNTSDGGNTWKMVIAPGSFSKVGFNGSPLIQHALDFSGIFYTSIDGGANWTSSNASNGECRSFAIAIDGTIYLQSADINNSPYIGVVEVSSDLGKTWSAGGASMDGDCFTLSVDSCNPKLLYLVNEQFYNPSDSIAKIYLSTDGGISWTIVDSHHALFYSGSMATTADGVIVGTVDATTNGISRSMDRGITWNSIGGPSNAPDTRNIAAISDNIILAADEQGNIWLTTNGGGDSVQSQLPGTLLLAPAQLFSTDTLGCDSAVRSIQIIRGCPSAPSLLSTVLGGPDSASYQIDSIAKDSITITLFPQKAGTQSAWLLGRLDNGTTDTVFLSGFVTPTVGTFSIAPNTLFTNDTLHCDSISSTVHLASSGCRPPALTQIIIGGPDAGSYRIIDSTSDSISVIWTSQKPGAQNAWLIAQLNNGESDSIALEGFSTSTPFLYSDTPQTLFSSDSLYIACDPATPSQIWVFDTACVWPNVISEQIDGADSADYVIASPMSSPMVMSDSVLILFQPKDTGLRSAEYLLTLSNGTIISIPLSGVGLAEHILMLTESSTTQHTDTIGATVGVPITIDGLARAETVEIVLHYPLPDLQYVGSFDPMGTQVDVPGQQWPGRSLLRITNAEPNAVAAYARFNVFSDTDYDPVVTFDSLDVTSAITSCEYSIPPAITDTIVPLEGCGIQMLSEWIHLGVVPLFSILPNPTTGTIELNATADLGTVWVEVYDVLGSLRGQYPVNLQNNVPTTLSLPFESGLYFLRIASTEGEAHLTVIINK